MGREAEHDRNRGKTRVLKRGLNMNRETERERDRKLIWREGRRGKMVEIESQRGLKRGVHYAETQRGAERKRDRNREETRGLKRGVDCRESSGEGTW